jgi:hypothetical protein
LIEGDSDLTGVRSDQSHSGDARPSQRLSARARAGGRRRPLGRWRSARRVVRRDLGAVGELHLVGNDVVALARAAVLRAPLGDLEPAGDRDALPWARYWPQAIAWRSKAVTST